MAQKTLLREIGVGVLMAALQDELHNEAAKGLRAKSCWTTRRRATRSQSRTRVEIHVHVLFLSLWPHRTASKELRTIQPKSQPSLDVALCWSSDAAARGRVPFGARPDGSSHHFRFYSPRWEVSPPLVSRQLCWTLFTWGHPLVPSLPQIQTLFFLCSQRTALRSL